MIDYQYHNLNRGVSQLTSLQYLAGHPQRNAWPASNLIIIANMSFIELCSIPMVLY